MLHDEIERMLIYVINQYHRVDDRLKAPFREFIKFARDHVDEMDILLSQMKAHDDGQGRCRHKPSDFGVIT